MTTSLGESGRSVKRFARLHLVSRLRIHEALPPCVSLHRLVNLFLPEVGGSYRNLRSWKWRQYVFETSAATPSITTWCSKTRTELWSTHNHYRDLGAVTRGNFTSWKFSLARFLLFNYSERHKTFSRRNCTGHEKCFILLDGFSSKHPSLRWMCRRNVLKVREILAPFNRNSRESADLVHLCSVQGYRVVIWDRLISRPSSF
jgi:hypothetical protein